MKHSLTARDVLTIFDRPPTAAPDLVVVDGLDEFRAVLSDEESTIESLCDRNRLPRQWENWLDLKSRLLGRLQSSLSNEELSAFDDLGDELTDMLEARTPRSHRVIWEDVRSDLLGCWASSRAPQQAGDAFFASVWHALCAHCVPCAWLGTYPEGRLAAYRIPLRES